MLPDLILFMASAALVALPRGVAAATCWTNLPKAQFANCANVTPSFVLHWNVDPAAGVMTFGVDMDIPSNSNPWIGVGLSDAGGMRGADLWLLLQHPENNTWYIQDSYSADFATPVADAQQDVVLLTPPAPSTSNIVYTFARAIDSCDPQDKVLDMGVVSNVVWAHGSSASRFSQHAAQDRGTFRTILYDDPNAPAVPPDPSDVQHYEMMMGAIPVPPTAGYICSHFTTPSDATYHVIEYEGVAQSKYLHHILVFACNDSNNRTTGDVFECTTMPANCETVSGNPAVTPFANAIVMQLKFVWAPGTPAFSYPEAAGVRIGKGAFQHFALQVHYTNPDNDVNKTDSSGIKLKYTSHLRSSDVGVLWIGSENIEIPGNSPSTTTLTPNICPSECTQTFPSNLTVFASFPHMHTLGLNLTTQHIRNGVELDPLSIRAHYDFNFQVNNAITAPSARTIMPGDSLITTCTYMPTAGVRTNTTTFGLFTVDEMCYDFLFYYPAMENIDYCMSAFENIPIPSKTSGVSSVARCATIANYVKAIQDAATKDLTHFPNGTVGPTSPAQGLAFLTDILASKHQRNVLTI
ncbi:hypothetical protein HK101_009711 [Irineochytrium annulatum]|nr:hypothetical protein HK101_009711 [Irineochytrium annulatum]